MLRYGFSVISSAGRDPTRVVEVRAGLDQSPGGLRKDGPFSLSVPVLPRSHILRSAPEEVACCPAA